MRPRKNIGFEIILNFGPKRPTKKPMIIMIEAKVIELTNARYAVTVVPMLLPNIMPRLLVNEIIPVFTSITVITVTAELDCISAVIVAPTIVPEILFLTNLPITL